MFKSLYTVLVSFVFDCFISFTIMSSKLLHAETSAMFFFLRQYCTLARNTFSYPFISMDRLLPDSVTVRDAALVLLSVLLGGTATSCLLFVVLAIETRACTSWASALSLVTSPACSLSVCQRPSHFTFPPTVHRGFHFFILLSVIMIFCILTSTILGDLRWSEFMYKNVYFKVDMPRGVWVSVVTLSTLQSSSW